MSRRAPVSVLLFASLLVAAGAQGQLSFEFSFSNPGARSLGLGGAFVALADDATAAYANPAGLVQITKAEVSIEGRSWSYSTPFVAGGRVTGAPTGIGLDTTPGLRRAESDAELTELSFLSFVYPLGKASLAFYRHQLARFESSVATQGFFFDGSTYADTDRLVDLRNLVSSDVVNYGVAAGFRVNETLSFGLGLSLLDADFNFQTELYLWDDESQESFFGENSYLAERLYESSPTFDGGTDLALIAGFLWRAPRRWSAGGFYRFGMESEIIDETRYGPVHPEYPAVSRNSLTVSLPDVYGLGIAFRSDGGRLTSSIEWDRLEYSNIFESVNERQVAVPDVEEWHWGIEYVFVGSMPVVAVRFGAWLDPDHRIRAVDGELIHHTFFRPGSDEIHLAAGLGLAFNSTFQLDLGVDFSDLVDTASVSMIYSF